MILDRFSQLDKLRLNRRGNLRGLLSGEIGEEVHRARFHKLEWSHRQDGGAR